MKRNLLLGALALLTAVAANADTYPRKILVEQFTTMKCGNCPAGYRNLQAGVADYADNVVWVAHHVGYYTDEFTVAESERFMSNGIMFAPAMMLDRTAWDHPAMAQKLDKKYSDRVVYINYWPSSSMAKRDLGAVLIKGAVDRPANVGIAIAGEFDPESREIKVKVDLERNADLEQDALLSVQLVENSCQAKGAQAGDASIRVHQNVFRRTLTDIYGDEIAWNDDNTASAEFVATAPEEWNERNLRIVAFVNRPMKGTSGSESYVLNVEDTGYFVRGNAIDTVSGNDLLAPVEYFTLQGVRVASPAAGQVVIRRQGSQVDKIRF